MAEIEPAAAAQDSPEMQRAEEMVDRMSQTIGRLASQVSYRILKGAARAREEAEDIWAEAQSVRRGES